MKLNNFFFPFIFLFLFGCKAHYVPVSENEKLYAVKDSIQTDTVSAIEIFLKPYRDSLSGIMNQVIGIAAGDFHKEKNGGSLGNMITDAMYAEALKQNSNCEGAVFNPGGIRIPDVMKGNITKGKLLELLPFDNELVILEIKGDVLEKWLNQIGSVGGWPVKFSMPIQFKNNKLFKTEVDTVYRESVNGKLEMIIMDKNIHEYTTYYIATNDYIANGGDNCDFLKGQKRINTGLLIRDIVSDYIKTKKNIEPNNEKRIQFKD